MSIAQTRHFYVTLLTRELQYAHNADILDDAVMGCLAETTVCDFLDSFSLDSENPEHRAFLREAIDAALKEGF